MCDDAPSISWVIVLASIIEQICLSSTCAAAACCLTDDQDGPTITHGGMATGAAVVAAEKYGAAEVVDPHPYFVGELQATLLKYPHIGKVVPAMGYSEQQVGGGLCECSKACTTPLHLISLTASQLDLLQVKTAFMYAWPALRYGSFSYGI